jgi:hypothetical protein
MNDPWPVSVSVRVYRRLVRAYPSKFRAVFGDEMVQVFRDLCLRGGKAGLSGVWVRALLDYAVSLVSEYVERGVAMTKSKWIQLSGWGLAVSGFLMMAGFAASTRPAYHPSNAAAWAVDPILNAVDLALILAAMLLMSAGMGGLLARFQDRAGTLGRAGLVFGAAAALVSAAGAAGLELISDSNPWWGLFMGGFLGVNLGLLLFGVACLRRRLFARWNGLPFAVGAVFLVFILISSGLADVEWPGVATVTALLAFALGLGLLGYRLQSEAVERAAVTPA